MKNKKARPGRTGLSNSESTDDYLKAILELSGSEDNPVSSNALAGETGNSRGVRQRHAPEVVRRKTVIRIL